jgi:hypothetical protein
MDEAWLKERLVHHSKLDRYASQILMMRYRNDASYEDILAWLRSQQVKASKSTLSRWLHAREQRDQEKKTIRQI